MHVLLTSSRVALISYVSVVAVRGNLVYFSDLFSHECFINFNVSSMFDYESSKNLKSSVLSISRMLGLIYLVP